MWSIALSIVVPVILSAVGGLISTAFVKTKVSVDSVPRIAIGSIAGLVALIVGLIGFRNLFGDSNPFGLYCNMPIALALLVFAWIMMRPRR
jgi:uncharacterized membrane protein